MTTATQAFQKLKSGAAVLTIAAALVTPTIIDDITSGTSWSTNFSTAHALGRVGGTEDGNCSNTPCDPSDPDPDPDPDPDNQCSIDVTLVGNVLTGTIDYNDSTNIITFPMAAIGRISQDYAFSYSSEDQSISRNCQHFGSRAIEEATWKLCGDPTQSYLDTGRTVNLLRDNRGQDCAVTPVPVTTTRVTPSRDPIVEKDYEAMFATVSLGYEISVDVTTLQDEDTRLGHVAQYVYNNTPNTFNTLLDVKTEMDFVDEHGEAYEFPTNFLDTTFFAAIKPLDGTTVNGNTNDKRFTITEDNICYFPAIGGATGNMMEWLTDTTGEVACPYSPPVEEPCECNDNAVPALDAFNGAVTPTISTKMPKLALAAIIAGGAGLVGGVVLLAGFIGRRRKDKAPSA